MAFPTIPTVGAGRVLSVLATSPSGTHTSPSLSSLTKNSGDLLIAIVITYVGGSLNAEFSAWGGGFTEFKDQSNTGTMAIGLAYKWSDGTETGTFTVTTVDTSTNDSAFFLLSIPGAHLSTPPEAGTMLNGTSAAADPGSFDPAGWAAEDTLWIAVAGSGETSTSGTYTGIASAPTNYTDYADSGISADAVGGVEGAVAFRQLNAASENVGVFSVDTSNARNVAILIAVRPNDSQSLTLGLIDAAPAIYAPTFLNLNALVLDFLDAAPAIYAPTFYAFNAIALGLIDAAPAIYAPTLLGINGITLGLIDGAPAIYAITVEDAGIGAQAIILGLIDAAPAIYAPTLAVGPVGVTLGLIDAAPAIYALTLSPFNSVSLGLVNSDPAIYSLSLLGVNGVVLDLVDSGSAIYALTLAPGPVGVSLGLIDAGPAIYALTVVDVGFLAQALVLGLIDAQSAIYVLSLVGGLQIDDITLGVTRQEFWPRRRTSLRVKVL